MGSPGILGELLTIFTTHLNVDGYIRTVKEKSMLRRLQQACADIVTNIAEMPDTVEAILDRAEAAIFKVTNQG